MWKFPTRNLDKLGDRCGNQRPRCDSNRGRRTGRRRRTAGKGTPEPIKMGKQNTLSKLDKALSVYEGERKGKPIRWKPSFDTLF